MNQTSEQLVDLSKMLDKEKDDLLKSFSEGSKVLYQALKICNDNGIRTKACCRGNHESEDYITDSSMYIAFDAGIDVFSYLSSELISDEHFLIDMSKDQNGNIIQTIYIYGINKDEIMLRFIDDIKTGKKENKELIAQKLNTPVNYDILLENFKEKALRDGFTYDEIEQICSLEIDLFNKATCENVSDEELFEISEKINNMVNEMLLRKKQVDLNQESIKK